MRLRSYGIFFGGFTFLHRTLHSWTLVFHIHILIHTHPANTRSLESKVRYSVSEGVRGPAIRAVQVQPDPSLRLATVSLHFHL